MKSQNNPIAGKSLKQLVDRLVSDSLNELRHTENSVVNEMPDNLCVLVDEQKEGNVISELLATVITIARNGDIHISADQFRDVVTIDIEDRNNYNGYALAAKLRAIEPDANRMGGSISIRGENQLVARVSFSFPLLTVSGNLPPAYSATAHRYYR